MQHDTALTPGEAMYVLGRLVKDRRIRTTEVDTLKAQLRTEISELEQRLADLRATSSTRTATARTARKRPVAPALVNARRLQGQYMGLIRKLTGRSKARIKKLAAEKGREAAIKEMRAGR